MIELLSTFIDGVNFIQTANKANAKIVMDDCFYVLEAVKHNLRADVSPERYQQYESKISGIADSLNGMWNAKQQRVPFDELQRVVIKQVADIQYEMENETEVSYEVVFFPHKASMWDSLESIWMAAIEDPACTCYVVPIPFYERNPDGSLATMFYEGDQFPEYVPITHYNEYDIAARRPDVTYITNPYDGGNYITTVAPTFYSAELKQYTDLLVYVPYFFTGGDFPESQTSLPAYRNVDKIILQHEKIMDYFLDPVLKEKIMPLGSPKADRMLRMESERPVAPEEWSERIRNKKVVMYNTSVSSILQNGIKVLQKMLFVFRMFKDRDDIVLLWRPHPLSKSTLRSMRPELYELYLKIEKAFLAKHMGILDNTPDVNAAVALSDAYIGEETSSVVHLFGITGKPVFTLSADFHELPQLEEKCNVHFLDLHLEGSDVWFVSAGYHALCKLDLLTEKVEVIGKLPVSSSNIFAYRDIQRVGNKLVMLPYHASEICEYNMEEKVFTTKPFKQPLIRNNFDRMIRYKDYLFFKPVSYPAVVRYSIKNGEMNYYSDCLDTFKGYRETEDEVMFIGEASIRGQRMLMASAKVNQVLEFDMETGASQIHHVGPNNANYCGMEFDGENYWLIPNESRSIIRWNYETGETVEYNEYPEGFEGGSQPFVNIVCCGEYLIAYRGTGNMAVKIDKNTGEMIRITTDLPLVPDIRKYNYYNTSAYNFFAKKIDDSRVVTLPGSGGHLLVFNIDKNKWSRVDCRLEVQDIALLSEPLIKRGFDSQSEHIPYACREDGLFKRLDNFLDYLQLDEHDSLAQKSAYANILNNIDGNSGEQIYQNMLFEIKGKRI
ncbi:hypothetical protein [Paenibacillus typhae]|uniref:hypothetical protein n=1 Tax=Paenibacillus typhae TaxID=1174501 RepID=UPI001C8D6173|nr:hypothetical protein [Paenibacillus typhae]